MGDKVLTISSGQNATEIVENNSYITSKRSIEMDDLMVSVKNSVDNAGVITAELAQFSSSMVFPKSDELYILFRLQKETYFPLEDVDRFRQLVRSRI